ncbi:hypothetical protein G6011_00516 [Alternaria panax]|uniref:Rhodopsin domain-containing protein n=1 Tax=Alternaria panax TaxID=48097 RepID=A0AAD4IJ30_9PLEO|nr:hypothetical protein G6011_00516 [Alternaria panax]
MATFPIHTSDQRAVLCVAFTFSFLAVLAVVLRLIAHKIARKRWTPADYLIITACIFAVGLQAISITGVFHAGIGYGHVRDIVVEYGLEPITKLLQIIIPLQFLWVLSLSCTKTSILYLGVINVITDVMVLLLPMHPLYHLQMATYKKVALVTVFGLGIFTCIISAFRIFFLSSMDFTDITFTILKANIFSCLEPCLAVVLACIPLMHPLLGRSAPTPYGSGKKSANTEPKSVSVKAVSGDGFERLDDDTSRLWLRPMERQHRVDTSDLQEIMPEDAREAYQESLDRKERNDDITG